MKDLLKFTRPFSIAILVKSKSNIMKHFCLISFSLLIILTACKKKSDDSNQPTPPEPITGVEILKQTVPPEGGTLTVENFSLEVPAGAFSTATTLTISRLNNTVFGSDSKSPVYFINNLPGIVGQDMVVTIGGLNVKDSLTTFLAEPTFVKSVGKSQIVYRKTLHQIENGKVKVIIPVMPSGGTKSAMEEVESFTVGLEITNFMISKLSSKNNFELTFPMSYASQADEIAGYLENAFTMFSSPNFSLDFKRRSNWPLQVTLCLLDPAVYGYQVASAWGDNYSSMEFNTSKLNDMPEMKTTAAHEFMHVVQGWYDPRNRYSKAKSASPHYWLDEAVATWVEERFAVSGYISAARKGNELEQFMGGLNETRDDVNARSFGYGMSGTIKYIIDDLGDGLLKTIYDNIYSGENPGQAIRLSMGMVYKDWYLEMIKDYSLGLIYSDVTPGLFLGGRDEKYTATLVSDTLFKLKNSYKQLASRIFLLDVSAFPADEQTVLSVDADQQEDQMIMVYGVKSKEPLMFLGQDANSVTVAKLKSVITNGCSKFIIICTNSNYNSSNNNETELSFKIRLVTQKQFLSLTLALIPAVHDDEYDDQGVLISSSDASFSIGDLTKVPCTQNGNIITASFPSPATGTVKITLHPDHTLSYTIDYQSTTAYKTESLNCTVNKVPYFGSTGNMDLYNALTVYPLVESFVAHTNYTSGNYDVYELIQSTKYDYGTGISLYY